MLLSALLAWALPGCSTNPATGARQFNVLSESREVAIGEEAEPEFLETYGGPIPSKAINDYVSDIGRALVAQSERTELPWSFHAVDSAEVNAFALPGGKIFITRGLMALFESEAQLAGVLGHEVGHVTAQHQGQQMSQALVVQGALIGLGVAAEASDERWLEALGVGAGVGGAVYLLSYGRGQELEADRLGVRYMSRAGYHPEAQVEVMRILAAQSEGRPQPPEMLSTHPLPGTRIEALEAWIRRQYPDRDAPGRFERGEQTYREQVLERLKSLPAPSHPPQDGKGAAS